MPGPVDMPFFVVVNGAGDAWVDGRPMRDQPLWAEHASFINGLMAEGVVVLGGPLPPAPRHRAMLLISEQDEHRVRGRLAEDPWVRAGILQVLQLEPWDIIVSNDRLDPVLAELDRPSRTGTG